MIAGIAPGADGTTALAVKVTVVPEDGKANAAIIAFLAKTMAVSRSSFSLVGGETSRHKTFRIDANQDKVVAWIRALEKTSQE